MKKTCLVALLAIAVSFVASAGAQDENTPKKKKEAAEPLFNDHPSMDRNAVVMPNEDARPISAVFEERPLLDASVAVADNGDLYLTGTPVRGGERKGIQLWRSENGGQSWLWLGVVFGDGRRYRAPEVHIGGEDIYLAYATLGGCAHVAQARLGKIAQGFRASRCLYPNARDVSLFIDDNGSKYLVWGGGHVAPLKDDFSGLAGEPFFIKPDSSHFKINPVRHKDWPVQNRIGERGAFLFKNNGRYYFSASEVSGRMRTATGDVYAAEADSLNGPWSKRYLMVPHAGPATVFRGEGGALFASYNPRCEDDFAMFCEQVGFVPLERAPDGRLRQAGSILTENSAIAARGPLVTSETMRDPSVTLAADGNYYLVGTLDGYGYQYPDGGIKVWKSSDLEIWEDLGFVFEWQGMGWTPQNIAELWAPEIRWVEQDKTFYIAFSVFERGTGGRTFLYRSTSGKARGPYENVKDGPFVKGIDGFLYEEGTKLYFIWGGGNVGELNADRSGFKNKPARLVDVDGENIGYEGNALIKVGNKYIVTGAEWHGPLRTFGTYDMMYGVSDALAGPYTKRKLGAPHAGHGTPFRDKQGRYWTTMFGNDPTSPWRMHFGLVPIAILEDGTVRALGIGEPHTGTPAR